MVRVMLDNGDEKRLHDVHELVDVLTLADGTRWRRAGDYRPSSAGTSLEPIVPPPATFPRYIPA